MQTYPDFTAFSSVWLVSFSFSNTGWDSAVEEPRTSCRCIRVHQSSLSWRPCRVPCLLLVHPTSRIWQLSPWRPESPKQRFRPCFCLCLRTSRIGNHLAWMAEVSIMWLYSSRSQLYSRLTVSARKSLGIPMLVSYSMDVRHMSPRLAIQPVKIRTHLAWKVA